MFTRSAAGVTRAAPKQLALVLLAVVVAFTSSCARHLGDKTTQELIAIVQKGEYDRYQGKGPACDAAYVLSLRKATEAVDVLVGALSTPAVDCMADALGEIGDVRAVAPLIGAFDAVSSAFEEDGAQFDSADEALVMIGTAAVDPLLAVAASGDEFVRDRVTYVLGRIRDPRAEAFLIERLKTLSVALFATDVTDENAVLAVTHSQRIVAIALARIFSDQADHLMPLLQSKETVAIAYGLVGLGEFGTEGELSDALMQCGDLTLAEFYLNSGNPHLRSAASDWGLANGYEITLPLGIPGDGYVPPDWGAIDDLQIGGGVGR